MAIQPRNTLKGWFITLAKPVQSQFWDWIDSFRHKSEKIGAADLDPDLLEIINALPPGSTIDQLVEDIANKADLVDGILKESQWPPLLTPDSQTYATNADYVIIAGRLLEKIVVIPTTDITLSIGNLIGEDDIQPGVIFPGGEAAIIYIDAYASVDRHIYFTGIDSETTIKFYIR
ncbi:hypothetical protein SAMN05428988_1300 [Chitinophaga sp. YR573]|uniref:hypothetical protein n=1 Tax=Chitinophaga sp. YR573 TaxID=1881040 RepID=UPI0008B078C4|nr:hypothetical protein [Chitinophaga sp. YR573]SEW01801.1 hypothetical protein SAMN05428988_1300 [Chitinophaga sp. YR573]